MPQWIPWTQVTAAGILAFTVVLILTGRIVPRRSLKDAQEQSDKWENAWTRSQETVTELTKQVNALTEIGRTTESLLHAILNQRGSTDPDGSDNVVRFKNGTS